MAIEIEKKYKLDKKTLVAIIGKLNDLNAEFVGDYFEENFLHRGGGLDEKSATLRLRKTGSRTTLTYKQKVRTEGGIKHKIEYETDVTNCEETENLLKMLGFRISVIYEKHRKKWRFGDVEVVLDELPFGTYMEIEGPAKAIIRAEKALEAGDLEAEMRGYPRLSAKYGKPVDGITESRFDRKAAV